MSKIKKTVKLVVSSGQHETSAIIKKITYTTEAGFIRRCRQLSRKYAVYGDNWRGWINANVAIASDGDLWGDNDIIGGQWCKPVNEWLDLTK